MSQVEMELKIDPKPIVFNFDMAIDETKEQTTLNDGDSSFAQNVDKVSAIISYITDTGLIQVKFNQTIKAFDFKNLTDD